MKNKKMYLISKKVSCFFLIVVFFSIVSCDYIENPYPEANKNVSDTSSCTPAIFPAVTSHVKKILIEDFTGHTCGNCPKAAKILHEIDSIYSDKIIGIGIHVGGYANPAPGYNGSPATAYTADYRTAAGELYDEAFGVSAFGLPQGMFNRKLYDDINKTHLQFYPNWKTFVSSIIAEPAVMDLQIISDFSITTRKICVSVRDSFLTALPGSFKLVVLLTQDNIVDWQDYIGVNKSDYIHRHILRDAITPSGAWGETITSDSVNTGAKSTNLFAYTIPASYKGIACDVNNCYLIAYIYNTANYEIIQSEICKVTP